MKFKFENVGLINQAELELADLTLICGENNTGKTYLTYGVYGFLSDCRGLLRNMLADDLRQSHPLTSGYVIDLEKMFQGKLNAYLKRASNQYTANLSKVFASNESLFKNSKITVSVIESDSFHAIDYQSSIQRGNSEKVFATLTKAEDSHLLEVLITEDAKDIVPLSALDSFIADAIVDIVFAPYLPTPTIACAERTGVAVFRKELDFARTGMIEALRTLSTKELRNPFRLIESMNSGYALPVNDNVNFIRQLEDLEKLTSPLAATHPDLLKAFNNIIGGSYKVIRDKGVIYQPEGYDKLQLSMNESSSAVRALLDIGFYLRCCAKPGDLFMIDEPELNLHPKNQRALARLIARMVNAGIKVFVTTHSDYLVKELNTLIMLAQHTAHTQATQQKYGYMNEELLDYSRVALYMTEAHKNIGTSRKQKAYHNILQRANITPNQGIEVTTFDTTIEDMNTIQSDILYGGDWDAE